MWVIYIIDFLVLFAFFAADAFLSAVGVAFPYLAFAILVSGITFALIKATKSKTGKVVVTLCVVLIYYAIGTPTGAVRVAVLLSGHPAEAVTLHVRKANKEECGLQKWQEGEAVALYRITTHAPNASGESRAYDFWSVSKHMRVFFFSHHCKETSSYLNIKRLSALQAAQESKSIQIYRAYEEFDLHGRLVKEGTIVVLENVGDGITRIVTYDKEVGMKRCRNEDVLLSSDLPPVNPGEINGPWCWILPLTTPHFKNKNNSGVYITAELYNELDPKWATNNSLDYYDIAKLVRQINAVNQK